MGLTSSCRYGDSFELQGDLNGVLIRYGAGAMPRANIIVVVDDRSEVAAVDAWFARWRSALNHVSEDYGWSCCMHIWQLEGPAEALAELPPSVVTGDEWTS